MSKTSSDLVSAGERKSHTTKFVKGDSAVMAIDPLACEGIASLADFLHEGIWIIDIEARTTFVNQQMASMLGYSVDEMLGQHLFSFMDEQEIALCKENLQRREQGIHEQHEFVFRHKHGQGITALITTTPLKDPQGNYQGAVAGVLDITSRKQSQEAYQTLVEHSVLGLSIVQDHRICFCNRAFAHILGYAVEEIQALSTEQVRDLVYPADRERVWRRHNERLAGHTALETYEARLLRKDGEICWVEVSVSGIRFQGRPAVQVTCLDITQKKQAETALRNERDRAQQYLDIVGVIVVAMDVDHRITLINRRGCEILGYEEEELLGQDWFARCIADDERARVLEGFQQIVRGDLEPVEYFENRVVTKEGQLRWIAWHNAVLRNKEGGIIGALSSGEDITELKQAESIRREYQSKLKALASQLTLTEERLKRNVATQLHDRISQPLAMSKMKLCALLESVTDSRVKTTLSDVSEVLGQTLLESRNITSQLSYPVLQVLGLETAIHRWLIEEVENKHAIRTSFVSDGQMVPLDEDVSAVLFRGVRELLTNVIKHAQASEVGVTLERHQHDIRICVEDNGCGCSMEQTFPQKGGFGLMSVQEALERLGGSLYIDSQPNQGLTATLTAPLRRTHA